MKRKKLWFTLSITWLALGCAGSLESNRSTAYAQRSLAAAGNEAPTPRIDAYCRSLDAKRRDWGAAAKVFVTLGGGSGLTAIPVDKEWQERGLVISSAVFAALAAGAFYVSEGAGDSWARDCSAP